MNWNNQPTPEDAVATPAARPPAAVLILDGPEPRPRKARAVAGKAHESAVLALLRQLIGKVDTLTGQVAEMRAESVARRAPGAADQVLANLLRLIHEFAPGHSFSVRELLIRSQVPDAHALQVAIAAALDGRLNGRALGKLFVRIEGRDLDGLRIECVGRDRDGAIWSLRVCEFQTRKPTSIIDAASSRGQDGADSLEAKCDD